MLYMLQPTPQGRTKGPYAISSTANASPAMEVMPVTAVQPASFFVPVPVGVVPGDFADSGAGPEEVVAASVSGPLPVTAPGDAAPGDAASGDTAPGDAAPGDAAPGDAPSGDTAPGDPAAGVSDMGAMLSFSAGPGTGDNSSATGAGPGAVEASP
jgi:hypothetical protein